MPTLVRGAIYPHLPPVVLGGADATGEGATAAPAEEQAARPRGAASALKDVLRGELAPRATAAVALAAMDCAEALPHVGLGPGTGVPCGAAPMPSTGEKGGAWGPCQHGAVATPTQRNVH